MSPIKKFRERAGLTQRALAAQVGVAEITVRKWETGSRSPRLGRIRELARALQCAPEKLL